MGIEIKECVTKSDFRKFVDFVNNFYKDVEQFVPAFYGDDLADWDKNKNPAFDYCEAKAFLCYKDGDLVGRIGAILSHAANEKFGTKRMRFSQVDFIDDNDVVDALFGAVEAWAKEKGCNELQGPLGFSDNDREGMLIEGFEKRSMFITYYNHPYYIDQLTRLGFVKDVDWHEYKIPVPAVGDDYYNLIHSMSERVLKNGNFHKVPLTNHRQYKPYIVKVFNLINEAYAELYGVVKLNDKQIEKYANKFVPLINPDYCALVVDENDELYAFGVCAPSMARAMQRHKGRLFPIGWISVLHDLRVNNAVDLLLMAVKPGHRGVGLNAVVLDHIMNSCIKNGIEYAESGPMLEKNTKMIGQFKSMHLEPHKKRRCFIKEI